MGTTTHIIICILATTIWLGCQAPQEETVPPEPLAEPIRHPLRGKHPFSEWELCVVEHNWRCCGFKTTFQEIEIEHFYDDEHRLQYHSVTLGDSIYNLFFRFHDEKSPQKNFRETYQYSPTSQYQVSVSPQHYVLDTTNCQEVRTLKNLLRHYSETHIDNTQYQQEYQLASLLIELYQKPYYQTTVPLLRETHDPVSLVQMHDYACLGEPGYQPSNEFEKRKPDADAWLVFEFEYGIIVFEMALPNYTNILKDLKVHVYLYRCLKLPVRWCGTLPTPTQCYGLNR